MFDNTCIELNRVITEAKHFHSKKVGIVLDIDQAISLAEYLASCKIYTTETQFSLRDTIDMPVDCIARLAKDDIASKLARSMLSENGVIHYVTSENPKFMTRTIRGYIVLGDSRLTVTAENEGN